MSETLVKFDEAISDSTGARYFVEAMGRQREDGLWEGYLEFLPVNERAERITSDRETTQPNRKAVDYWAQGLSRVYLAGALNRARLSPSAHERARPMFDSRPKGR
jgi:hypothetical protein